MASAHDVARYILEKHGSMTAMKLQKLLYYCQAWSLVWDERAMFSESIRAWANGPVVYEIYCAHRGQFIVSKWPRGDANNLDSDAIETIEAVMQFYGDRNAQWLSDLTHQEKPWREARDGIAPGEWSDQEITQAAMHEYYSSLS